MRCAFESSLFITIFATKMYHELFLNFSKLFVVTSCPEVS